MDELFKDRLDAIMRGDAVLPNMEEMELSSGVAAIACPASMDEVRGVRSVRVPGPDSLHRKWARYFLWRTQGGVLDGQGYVMFWDHGNGRIARFAVCKHKKIAGPGADPRRGWYPGRCAKCGLDMTVDSGD